MTYRSVPNSRKVSLFELSHPCPEAGGRSRTVQPRVRLDRWTILRDLLVDAWANRDEPTEDLLERHLGSLSLLESSLIRRMYLNVTRMLPIPDEAEVDTVGHSVSFDDTGEGITTSVHLTFTITHGDGSVERLRLKTGRTPSTPEEAAVVWTGAEEGESFTDLMAWPGELEPIEAPSDAEERLRMLVESAPVLHLSGVRPGRRCVWCERSAVCGAFPADRVVPVNAQTINLTKTDIVGLGQCHRRVAWRRLYAVPRDDGDAAESSAAGSQGRLFHDMVQVAEGSDAPTAAAHDYLRGVSASEVADLAMMWETHRAMMEAEGLSVRLTEFPVGFTLLEGPNSDLSGVTLIAFVDLTARDGFDRPVAVELKTGGPGDTGVEDDLYAVGMRRWVGSDVPLVVHRHQVRSGTCEVVTVQPDEVVRAVERLQRRVLPVHDWDWENPLQPDFSVGAWCSTCEYRGTCEGYR
ncbi:hypothetical protein BH23ACT5_BH23ACT5_12810 [soil metagenome]